MDATTLSPPRLAARGLTKSFGHERVLDGVDLMLAPGETLAVIGRSGCGKSTLLRCLNLIDIPEQGQIALDGEVYADARRILYAPWEVRRNIAMVFQQFHLFPNMSVRGNITLALRKNLHLSTSLANQRAQQVAAALKIADILDKYPNEISGGQAQRCALARAIVLQPKVFLLDEITSALDPIAILDVIDAIRSLRETGGGRTMSVIIVTHLMHFAESFADRIAFLHAGRIHEEHAADVFFSVAAKPETKAFISAYQESR